MYGDSKLLRMCDDFFLKNWTKKNAAPLRMRRLYSVGQLRCCGVAEDFLAIRDTPIVCKPIRNCVWAVLMGQANDVFPTRRDL